LLASITKSDQQSPTRNRTSTTDFRQETLRIASAHPQKPDARHPEPISHLWRTPGTSSRPPVRRPQGSPSRPPRSPGAPSLSRPRQRAQEASPPTRKRGSPGAAATPPEPPAPQPSQDRPLTPEPIARTLKRSSVPRSSLVSATRPPDHSPHPTQNHPNPTTRPIPMIGPAFTARSPERQEAPHRGRQQKGVQKKANGEIHPPTGGRIGGSGGSSPGKALRATGEGTEGPRA
jgi:hypothetical protein